MADFEPMIQCWFFKPVISIKDGRHPCSVRLLDGEDFIPNDTSLGCLAVSTYSPTITAMQCSRSLLENSVSLSRA